MRKRWVEKKGSRRRERGRKWLRVISASLMDSPLLSLLLFSALRAGIRDL